MSLNIASVENASSPFRPVTQAKEDKSAIKRVMATTVPEFSPSYALQSDDLFQIELSPGEQEYLNNLHDEYLLW